MIPFGSTFIASNTIPSHLRIRLLAPGSETSGGSALPDGEIANMPKATAKSVKTLPPRGIGVVLLRGRSVWVRDLSPTHGVRRCPSGSAPFTKIVTKTGDLVNMDRHDGESLSRLPRAGELTPIRGPGQEQEAIQDFTRAREDMESLERITKQRLNAFLLWHGRL